MSNQERMRSMRGDEDSSDDISGLLENIEDKKVRSITDKLIRMNISGKDKLSRLEPLLNGNQMKKAEKIIAATERNFVDDLSLSDQEFAEMFIPKNDFTVLDEIMKKKKYSRETKLAYSLWKDQRKEEGTLPSPSTGIKRETSEASERGSKRHFQDSMTILLMGETGVGKSTFINTLANMIAYPDFDCVLKNQQLHVPISATMTFVDKEFQSHKISYESTLDATAGEVYEDGVSCTQKPKTYVFHCGPLENRRELRIIDTPGFGDTRGTTRDKVNMKNILDAVTNHREIHAIIYLLPPNNSKLSESFRYCLNEFFAHLHKSATDNIFFCFTNARSTHYLPGETKKILETYLKELKTLNISLTKKNLFVFENDAFRYLCSVKKNKEMVGGVEKYRESWRNAAEEYKRLLSTVARMDPHNVQDMLSVNNVRKVAEILHKPLGVTKKLILVNIKKLNEKEEESKKLREHSNLLEKKLIYDVVELKTELVDRPIIVCDDPACITVIPIYNVTEKLHKTTCYSGPTLIRSKGTAEEIRSCPVFQEGICKECNHSWKMHVCKEYKLVPVIKKVLDMGHQEKFETAKKGKEKLEDFIKDLAEFRVQYEEELRLIRRAMIISSLFLKNHAIIPYEDKMDESLEVEGETEMYEGELAPKTVSHYEQEYWRMVEVKGDKGLLAELWEMITQLKKSKNCGQFLRDVEMLEQSSKKKEQGRDEVHLELGSDYNKNIFG